MRINDPGCVARPSPIISRIRQCDAGRAVIGLTGLPHRARARWRNALRPSSATIFSIAARCTFIGLGGATARHRTGCGGATGGPAESIDILFEGADIWLDGVKVGDELRTEQSGAAASKVAALPGCGRRCWTGSMPSVARRAWWRTARHGFVVFPDAALKIFMTPVPRRAPSVAISS